MSASVALRPMGGAAYGAEELKQAAQRNGFLGLVISVAIHFAAIGIFYALPEQPYRPPRGLTPSAGNGDHVIDLSNEPRISGAYPLPRSPIQQTPSVHEGTPVPVIETPSTVETTIPFQGDMGYEGTGTGDAGTSSSGGTGLDESPIRISDDVEPAAFVPVEKSPVIIKAVHPVYPAMAIQAGLEGKVIVKIWVDRQGRARKAEILKSDFDIFNQAALDAASQYLFTPAYMSGGPVSVWVSVPFIFKLKERG